MIPINRCRQAVPRSSSPSKRMSAKHIVATAMLHQGNRGKGNPLPPQPPILHARRSARIGCPRAESALADSCCRAGDFKRSSKFESNPRANTLARFFRFLRSKNSEEVGFEPTNPCGFPVFKTGAIGHSATLPRKTQSLKGLEKNVQGNCERKRRSFSVKRRMSGISK
jgi:hypothetical protein